MGFLWFFLGMVVGANLGVFFMCLFICAKDREKNKDKLNKK